MVAKRSTCGTVMLVAGIIFTIITIIFVAISFSTDFWIEYTVRRDVLTPTQRGAYATNGRYTFSRNRGLFRECYSGNDTTAFLNSQTDIMDSNCFKVDLSIPDATSDVLSTNYLSRVHLLRACIAFYAVALLINIITFIVGLVPVSCSRRSKWAFTAGFLSFCIAFFVAAAIAFFHGAEYLEKRKITDVIGNQKYYQSWDNEIKIASDSVYRYSYALGWVGVGCAIITAILYVIAGFYIGDERYDDREYLDKGRGRDYVQNGYDNRGYPGPYPYPPPPMPYGPGPYVQDLDSGRQLQPMPYWSWS